MTFSQAGSTPEDQGQAPLNSTDTTGTEQDPSSSGAQTPPRTSAEKADAVAALFAAQNGEETEGAQEPPEGQAAAVGGEGTPEGEEGAPAGAGEASGLQAAIDKDPSSLYALEVTTGDGEKVPVGKLKDFWQGRVEAERETAQTRATMQRQLAANQRETELLQQLGPELWASVSPERKERWKRHQAQQVELETQKLVNMAPELANPQTAQTFMKDVQGLLRDLNLDPMGASLSPSEQAIVARELIAVRKELAQLRDWKPNAPKPKRHGRGRAKPAAARKQLQPGASHEDRISAVSEIMKGL